MMRPVLPRAAAVSRCASLPAGTIRQIDGLEVRPSGSYRPTPRRSR